MILDFIGANLNNKKRRKCAIFADKCVFSVKKGKIQSYPNKNHIIANK